MIPYATAYGGGGMGSGWDGGGDVMQEVVGANGWGEEIATQETENG